MPGRPATLTQEQRLALEEFRQLLNPIDIAQIKMPHEDDDKMLFRVLRADDFNVKLCKASWDVTLKWRKENQIFAQMTESATSMIFGNTVTLSQILKKYPYGIKGVDKRGRPLSFKLGGVIDHSIFTELGVAKIVLWEAVVASKTLYYRLPRASIEAKTHIENYVQIVDLNGMGITSFGGNMKTALKDSIRLCGDHFPETMGCTYIINAPWYFRTVWAVVRTFMEPQTARKVNVCGDVSELHTAIDMDMLPIEYGGSGKLGLHSIKDLYTPDACWELEQGRPEKWGEDPYASSDSRLLQVVQESKEAVDLDAKDV